MEKGKELFIIHWKSRFCVGSEGHASKARPREVAQAWIDRQSNNLIYWLVAVVPQAARNGSKMKYLVCRKQDGDGCDYTIGCGMAYSFIEASSIEDVIEEIIYPDGRDEYCELEGENALDEILVIPADAVITVDVSSLLKGIEASTQEAAKAKEQEVELAQLKRLQAKYPREVSQ